MRDNKTRWITDTPEGHSQWLIDHFRRLAREGADLGGEARFVSAVIDPGTSVLDAGCGTGRVGSALNSAGYAVVGVDADELLIASAREDHPGVDWVVADLRDLDLRDAGQARRMFDSAVLAGNVMPFLEPDTEVLVLRSVAAHVRDGGPVIVGFGSEHGYTVDEFDSHVVQAGLRIDNRFSTWSLAPWRPGSPFSVTILRSAAHRTDARVACH